MKKLTSLVILALLLTACASAPDNLARESARIIGGVRPDRVTISDVKRGVTSVTWTATTPSGVYDCSSDDMLRRPMAVKRTESTATSEAKTTPALRTFPLNMVDQAPKAVSQPGLTLLEAHKGLSGEVLVSFAVTHEGKIVDVKVLRSTPADLPQEIRDAAVACVSKWQFKAAKKSGRDVAVRMTHKFTL